MSVKRKRDYWLKEALRAADAWVRKNPEYAAAMLRNWPDEMRPKKNPAGS